MSKRADLNPALGLPSESGPCYVVQRIEDEVRSRAMRDLLQEKVEKGKELSNPEARTVYDTLKERGPGGMFKQMEITGHAQYRMDLRGVTVPEIRITLQRFQKKYNDYRSQKHYMARHIEETIMRGQVVEYEDKKLGLFVAFSVPQKGVARIVTVYWKGLKDPKAPGVCVIPHTHKHGGYRAPVDNWTPQTYRKEPGETPDNQEKQQVLPSPPHTRSKPTGPWNYNVPGPSGTGPGGKSIHKDKARTQGKPGGDHPAPPPRTSPQRRPEVTGGDMMDDWDAADEQMAGWFDRLSPSTPAPFIDPNLMEASMRGKPYPGADRQREQKGPAKTYSRLRYRRKRVEYKRRMKLWHRKNKRNPRYKKDQWRREKYPKRFERRPGGGYRRNEDRAKDWRKDQKNKPKKRNEKKASLNIPVFNTELWEWATFLGIEEPMVKLWVDQQETLVGIDEFFDVYVVPEDEEDNLFAEFDRYFEYEEGTMSDIDEALDQMQKLAVQFKLRYRPKKRQRKQKGRKKWQAKMRARKNRAKNKRRSRIRYKRLKRLPAFKKQQQIRRKHPERYKRRMAEVLTAPEIAFVIGESLDLGYVRNISPMTGLVTFYRQSERTESVLWDTVESLPVEDFMAAVAFLSEFDEDAMFKLVDAELGEEAWYDDTISSDGLYGAAALMGIDCDSAPFKSLCEKLTGKTEIVDMDPAEMADVNNVIIHRLVYDDDSMDAGDFLDRDLAKDRTPGLIDPTDGDWYFGQVNIPPARVARMWIARQAEMLYNQDGPKVDPDQYFGRADKRKREQEKKPLPKNFPSEVLENPGSAKVIPWNTPDNWMNNKGAAFDFNKIPHDKRRLLFEIIKTPMWRRYMQGIGREADLLKWFQERGWDLTEKSWRALTKNVVNMYASTRIAANLHDIMDRCGEDLINRSRGLKAKLVRVDPKNAVWLFDVPGSKSDYRVRVKASRKGNLRDMHKADVKVSCSCPFWQWQGPEYHAKTGDYLYGKPVGTASRPVIKDPSNKHAACKHVVAVLNHISTNNWRVPRSKRASAQYLLDTSSSEEVSFTDTELRALAARYIGLKGGS